MKKGAMALIMYTEHDKLTTYYGEFPERWTHGFGRWYCFERNLVHVALQNCGFTLLVPDLELNGRDTLVLFTL